MRILIVALFLVLIGPSASLADTFAGQVNSEDIPLRLRAGPGLDFAVLAYLPDTTPLYILARSHDESWLYVRTTDTYNTGWVYAEYVTLQASAQGIPLADENIYYPGLISGVSDTAYRIYQTGQQMGNQAYIFAKVGDSITVSRHVLHPLGSDSYNLAAFDYLQPTVDFFSQADSGAENAFTTNSVAAGVGWNAAAVLQTRFADPNLCAAGSIPLLCEYERIKPAFALIMFGTNDVGYVPAEVFRHNMERIITLSIEHGVVPVISTIPPRIGYDDEVFAFNQIIRELAQQHEIPLWDYYTPMTVNSYSSLGADGVHPTLPPRGHAAAADFSTQNLYYGYVIRNLVALHALDALRTQLVEHEGQARLSGN